MPQAETIEPGQIYRHYKGKDYLVRGLVHHSESLETLVLYDCLYENKVGTTWVRPIDNFLGFTEIENQKVKRFVRVSSVS